MRKQSVAIQSEAELNNKNSISKQLDQSRDFVNAGDLSSHKCQICGSGAAGNCELPDDRC